MKTVVIETVPHDEQRYDTVGDYQESEHAILVRVSNLPDERYEQLVAVHELVEKILCNHRGVKDSEIDAFDLEYEANRLSGDESEPGDAVACPYRAEHQFATKVEKLLAAELGVDWEEYELAVNSLKQGDTCNG